MRILSDKFGITFLEILVVLTIVAITAPVGVHYLKRSTANSRVQAATANFVSNLRAAKAQAQEKGINVVLCPISDSSNIETCLSSTCGCTSQVTWNYWKVYENGGADLKYVSGFPFAIRSTSSSHITYSPTGVLLGPDMTFNIRANGCTAGKDVIVRKNGTISITDTGC